MTDGSVQFVAVDASVALAGIALLYWSDLLSKKYNAWTTRLRTQFPSINPPPTPKMAQLNYMVMLNLLRTCGIVLIAAALWAASTYFHR